MSADAAIDPGRAAGLGVMLAACVSALVVNANTSAVSILLPSISKDVDAPVAQLQWAVTGYSLVGAAVIVTSGALGDVFGRRKVFLGGLVLFVVSCALIALSTTGGGVVAGRMIQGAAGSTILACGMSLLSVAASGAGQMRAITIWGAASAAGGAAGPLIGGLLVGTTGWQGLFWIDAAIAAAVHPADDRARWRSRATPTARARSTTRGRSSSRSSSCRSSSRSARATTGAGGRLATLGCFAITIAATFVFVAVEQRVSAPLVDLKLLRNRILVGATLAILIVAGTINALMYVL